MLKIIVNSENVVIGYSENMQYLEDGTIAVSEYRRFAKSSYEKIEIVESIPVDYEDYKYKYDEAVGFTIQENWVDSDLVVVDIQELQNQLKEVIKNTKTANENYADVNLASTSLVDLKEAKILQLKQMCSEAIYSPFSSVKGYTFGFNEKDQLNFNGRLNKVNLWLNQVSSGDLTQVAFNAKFPMSWKSINSGVVQLSLNEFVQVTEDGEKHLMNNQVKYWQKEAQVLGSTTKEQVDAVVW